MEAPALATLRQVAAAVGKGDAAAARIVALEAAIGADLARVDADLARALDGVAEPARSASRHLVGAGGKRVRPSCVLVTSRVMGEGGATAARFPLAAAAELIHSATLLHDDVIDDGRERRGLPAPRVLWGNLVSVLSGDYLLVRSLELVASANVAHVLDDLLATLRALVEGEVLQLRGRDLWDLDVERYLAVVHGKTASLFRWSARAGARAAGAPSDVVDALGEYGEHLGVAFQVTDDVLDFDGDPAALGKAVLSDLREGKATLPLLEAARREPRVAESLQGDPATLVDVVRRSGGVEAAREFARAEANRAVACLTRVPAGPVASVLASLAQTVVSRAK